MSLSLRTAVRAAAAVVALAGGFVAAPAMAENEWTGSRLIVRLPAGDCRIAILRAYGGTTLSPIKLSVQNRGPRPLQLSGDMELAGNGSSKTGTTGPISVTNGTTNQVATQLTTYGGDMATTTLTVKITSCRAQ